MNTNSRLLKWMLLLAFVGACLSFFIFITDKFQVSGICPTNGCALVAASKYSTFLFIPISIWGMLYYLFMSTTIILGISRRIRRLTKYFNYVLGLLILTGVIFTAYLRYLEFFKIGAICVWCWGSVLVILAISILYSFYIKKYGFKEKEAK